MSRRRHRERGAAQRSETISGGGRATATISGHVTARRSSAIDASRGVAIVLMVLYHFCFDLRYYGITRSDFENDPFWLGFRGLILSSFLLLVGIALVLADRAGQGPWSAQFWRRCAVIAMCALAVSAASYIVFPARFIYFGVLHCIFATSIIASPLVRRPRIALALGAAIVIAGLSLSHPAFDQRGLSWIGFMTTKPPTEDYVPLAPWSGLVFLGIALGHTLVRVAFRPLAPLARAPRWLSWMGRRSLAIYMTHQPILLGLLWVLVRS